MLKTSGMIITSLLLLSCSFYSSAGRKQFEEKAPAQIQAQTQAQTFTFVNCTHISAGEMWVRDEFPAVSHEILELTPELEIWQKNIADGQIEITRIQKDSIGAAESCVYLFPSLQSWEENQNLFLSSADKSSEDLD